MPTIDSGGVTLSTLADVSSASRVVVEGGPHGCNVSHAGEFNKALLEFLAK